jgi:hypothetical protein
MNITFPADHEIRSLCRERQMWNWFSRQWPPMSNDFDIVDDRAPGWRFRATETSMNVYLIEGRDSGGRLVSRQGHRYDDLFNEVVADAVALSRHKRNSN